jgi:hypothetical protein
MAANKHEMLHAKNVAEKSHFLPVRIMMYMAMQMAGTSTKPERACLREKLNFHFG